MSSLGEVKGCVQGAMYLSLKTSRFLQEGGSLTFQSPPGKAEMEPIISESTKTPTGYAPPALLTQMANKIDFSK